MVLAGANFLRRPYWKGGTEQSPHFHVLFLASRRVISVADVVHRVCGAISHILYSRISVLSPVESSSFSMAFESCKTFVLQTPSKRCDGEHRSKLGKLCRALCGV